MVTLIPQHPGLELKSLILDKGMNLSQFARSINVSSSRISEIVAGKRSMTIDSAVKFAAAFDTTPPCGFVSLDLSLFGPLIAKHKRQ